MILMGDEVGREDGGGKRGEVVSDRTGMRVGLRKEGWVWYIEL